MKLENEEKIYRSENGIIFIDFSYSILYRSDGCKKTKATSIFYTLGKRENIMLIVYLLYSTI